MVNSVLKGIDAISEWSGKIISFLIFIGIGVLVYEVTARYVFNAPTIWAHGITQRLFASYAILLGAYCLQQGGHVRVDIIYNLFPLRARAILDLIMAVGFFLFCGVLLLWGADFAITSVQMQERCNTVFNAPLYPVKVMVPIGALLIILQGLANFVRSLFIAATGRSM